MLPEAGLAVLESLRNKQEKLSPGSGHAPMELDNGEDVRTRDMQAWERLYHRVAW